MNNPKVSLIIPVYNGEKYIELAIKSALNQTYKNLEIIVVNDGSTDRTEAICNKYKSKIKYFSKENGGVSTALNLAIKNMTGEYFSWLSHDDLYYPNKIEEEIKYASYKNIVMSDYDLIDENGKMYYTKKLNHGLIKLHNEYALLNGLINGITLLIPKKAFDECGCFDESLWCTQDYDMWKRMMLKGYKFVHVDKVLASSRQHQNQTTNTSPKTLTEGNKFWIDMIDTLPEKMVMDVFGSKYNFYREMADTYKITIYKKAYEYVLNKKNELIKNIDISKELVSVIIPFYDETISVINRALSSVINQTHKNIEIILINDNPGNYNNKDIKSLIKDKRINYIENKENIGVSASRNKGIKQAKGSYITFLDSDDEYLPNKIEYELTEMIMCNGTFAHTSYYRCDKSKVVIDAGKQNGYVLPELMHTCMIATPCVMIKKDIIEKNKYYFNENIAMGEDTCLWLNIAIKNKFIGIDEPLVNVYTDDASSAYVDEKQIIGIKNILRFVCSNDELSSYDKELATLANLYYSKVNGVNCYDEELAAILNSKSWKITKPLRLLSKSVTTLKEEGIKGLFRKIKRYLCQK